MLPLTPARTSRLQSGDAVSRVMSDCERIEPFYAHTIAPAVAAIFVPGIILAWCYSVDPSFLAVLAPFYLATTFLLPWLVAKLGGDGVAYREQLGQVNAYVSDSIQGVRDTVAFGYEKRRGEQLWRIGATMQQGQEKLYAADATQRALGEIFVTVGILAAAWWGIELTLDGKISAYVDLPAVIAVSVIGFYTSIGLANNYTDFRVSIIAARRLFSMMDQPPAVRERQTPLLRLRNHLRCISGTLPLSTIRMTPSGAGGAKVREGFSLDIDAGRHVALVGPSGTGKSTLINLLLRHWDVLAGEVTIGDQPLASFPLETVQNQFAVVSQRSYIFNESIRHNILFGRPTATEAEWNPRLETPVCPNGLTHCPTTMRRRRASGAGNCQAASASVSRLPGLFLKMRRLCSSMSLPPAWTWRPRKASWKRYAG